MTGVVEHTPGPWVVARDHEISASGTWEEDGFLCVSATRVLKGGNGELGIVVMDMNIPNNWDDDLFDANFALIQAAPDLLKALEWAMSELRGQTKYTDPQQALNCFDIADAALAKARGEHPNGEKGL